MTQERWKRLEHSEAHSGCRVWLAGTRSRPETQLAATRRAALLDFPPARGLDPPGARRCSAAAAAAAPAAPRAARRARPPPPPPWQPAPRPLASAAGRRRQACRPEAPARAPLRPRPRRPPPLPPRRHAGPALLAPRVPRAIQGRRRGGCPSSPCPAAGWPAARPPPCAAAQPCAPCAPAGQPAWAHGTDEEESFLGGGRMQYHESAVPFTQRRRGLQGWPGARSAGQPWRAAASRPAAGLGSPGRPGCPPTAAHLYAARVADVNLAVAPPLRRLGAAAFVADQAGGLPGWAGGAGGARRRLARGGSQRRYRPSRAHRTPSLACRPASACPLGAPASLRSARGGLPHPAQASGPDQVQYSPASPPAPLRGHCWPEHAPGGLQGACHQPSIACDPGT